MAVNTSRDLTGSVPGLTRCQLGLFDERDVGLTFAYKVLRQRCAVDTAADNNDSGGRWNHEGHSLHVDERMGPRSAGLEPLRIV